MMFTALKAGALGGVFAVLNTVVSDAAGEVVAVVAAMTALGWFWSRMILPAAKGLQRTHAAVGALEDLGAFMNETRVAVNRAELAADRAARKADALDLRLDLLERHVGLFAAEDALRVRQALEQIGQGGTPTKSPEVP